MNAYTTVIDQSTVKGKDPIPKIEGAKLIAPDTMKLIITPGYELYHMRDEIDNKSAALRGAWVSTKISIVARS